MSDGVSGGRSDADGAVEPSGPGIRSRFTVDVRDAGRSTVLALDGELDHDTAPVLRARLDEALEEAGAAGQAAPSVVVDCTELRFCDSTGLNVLLGARLRAEELGVELRLAALRGHVVRMFDITGAATVFTIHPDLGDALAAG